MTEHTPASSFVAQFDWEYEPPHHRTKTGSFNSSPSPGITPGKRTKLDFRSCVRILNAVLHIVPCLVLLPIIGHATRKVHPEPGIVL